MNALKFLGLEDNVVVKEVHKQGSPLPPIQITVKDIRRGKVKDRFGQVHDIVMFLRKSK